MIYRAVPWLRRLDAGLSPWNPGLAPRSIHVGFVVDKVAVGEGLLRVILFFPVNIIPPSFSILIDYIVLGMNNTYVKWQQFRDVVLPHQKSIKHDSSWCHQMSLRNVKDALLWTCIVLAVFIANSVFLFLYLLIS
jgi:hypothetical protein